MRSDRTLTSSQDKTGPSFRGHGMAMISENFIHKRCNSIHKHYDCNAKYHQNGFSKTYAYATGSQGQPPSRRPRLSLKVMSTRQAVKGIPLLKVLGALQKLSSQGQSPSRSPRRSLKLMPTRLAVKRHSKCQAIQTSAVISQ
ncbi:hypothetical protein AXF42_Ash018021 [Apostasia shenzhenica]|uniref:Uncharacterized protein n=1 Tax=Apostasia shenzhenica TaxID=1088818 RepID=A0A2I0AVI0_9ASPA|nr:hypothetical protein AXF42_Ash018021 [Apostasia shenzhenica]